MITIIRVSLQRINVKKLIVMELRQLISFVAVADTGSMSNAAIRCHVTQGAISHHIKSLEDELETVLIDRRSKETLLTESECQGISRSNKRTL